MADTPPLIDSVTALRQSRGHIDREAIACNAGRWFSDWAANQANRATASAMAAQVASELQAYIDADPDQATVPESA
jgi:hypothetical protein